MIWGIAREWTDKWGKPHIDLDCTFGDRIVALRTYQKRAEAERLARRMCHRRGLCEYRYFAVPLPAVIAG